MRMRRILFSSVASLVLQYVRTLADKEHNFGKKLPEQKSLTAACLSEQLGSQRTDLH
jgi:hypothetical protein